MSDEMFNNYSNGMVKAENNSSLLKFIQSNTKILSELENKQKLLKQETHRIQSDMNSFSDLMQNKFHKCLDENKEFIKGINGFLRDDEIKDGVTINCE